jgi:hypothetical protein
MASAMTGRDAVPLMVMMKDPLVFCMQRHTASFNLHQVFCILYAAFFVDRRSLPGMLSSATIPDASWAPKVEKYG